jgi:hypothetical protein
VLRRAPTAKDFSKESQLHFRPFPEGVEEELLSAGVDTEKGMCCHILEILICCLHWKLRVCECLVSRIVHAISSSPSKIEAINAIWKRHGIHATISKSEGSSTWGVHGMDGDSVDMICGFYSSWIPEEVRQVSHDSSVLT